MPLIVKDHREFQHAVARCVLVGGAAAITSIFVPLWVAVALGALGIGISLAAPANRSALAIAVLWACAAGGAAKLGGLVGAAGGAFALAGQLSRGTRGFTRGSALLLGATGALAAGLVGGFLSGGALADIPIGIALLAAGAAAGGIVGVAGIGRELALSSRGPEHRLRELAADDELGQLLLRAADAYSAANEALADHAPAAREAAGDLVARMTSFAERWREVERQVDPGLSMQLGDRLSHIDRKIESTADEQARAELARARGQLSAQVEYIDEIARGRERAVARLTLQVSMLERLRFQALRHRSVDASRLGDDLASITEELAQAGGELDLLSEALAESGVPALQAASGSLS
jgi:hypothetical protein